MYSTPIPPPCTESAYVRCLVRSRQPSTSKPIPNSATNISRYSSGSTSHWRSMPSLTRNATPNNDSTTPTFTGTLPVVNQRHTFVRNTSNGDGSNSLRTAGRGARTAGAASAVAELGGGALGRGGGAGSGAGGSAARGAA